MAIVYVSFGSNIAGRLKWIEMGRELLENTFGRIRQPPIYESNPLGKGLTRLFLNGVWEIETDRPPEEVLHFLRKAEEYCGRVARDELFMGEDEKQRETEHEDRTLDLDLLLYDDLVMTKGEVVLPHPRMHLRRFVLQPLADISSSLMHPKLKKTVTQLLNENVFEGQELSAYP